MKLISNKYIAALLLAIVLLVTTVSYMSYDVIIAQPIPKTPEEIIDSLKLELKYKDSLIQLLGKRGNKNPELISLHLDKKNNTGSSVPPNIIENVSPEQEKSAPTTQHNKSVSHQPVFVGF